MDRAPAQFLIVSQGQEQRHSGLEPVRSEFRRRALQPGDGLLARLPQTMSLPKRES